MDYPKVTAQVAGSPGGTFHLQDLMAGDGTGLEQYRGTADLVYIDPPFFTNQPYAVKQRVGTAGYLGRREYQLSIENRFDSFESSAAYEAYLVRLLQTAHALLKENGSIYIHVDFRAGYLVRKAADEIFGGENLLNEIIWHYRSGGRAKRYYSRKHDTIFFYKKNRQPYFDPAAVGVLRGEARRNNMKRGMDADGRVYYSIHSSGKEYRYYADSVIYPDDVWSDISHLQQKDPERTGYPTQKPLALLQRVIRASCPKGGLVADLCSGSGTTAVAAVMEGRRYLAVDQSPLALAHLRQRMITAGYGFHIVGGENAAERTHLGYTLGGNSKERLISLESYEIMGYQNPYGDADHGTLSQISIEDYDLQPTCTGDISLVDYAGAGYLKDGILTLQSVQVRNRRQPMLQRVLHLMPEEGLPCITVGDVFGNCSVFPIL